MFKRITLLRRRDDISETAFRNHWADVHADIATGFCGLERYTQNRVDRICWQTGASFQVDGVVELWFASQAAVAASTASETSRALIEDEPNFVSGLTALAVGAAESGEPQGAESKYMILARSSAPGRLEAGLRAMVAELCPADRPLALRVERMTPGFTRRSLWSEPEPPNTLVTIWARNADATGALMSCLRSPLRLLFEADRAGAATALTIDALRIV
ncbi:EthD family reductase [Salipiger sp. P9]|uniref:EthD family reductase n=1 Tax=Salipiger pentaromativorans TaxID=2943193 RepID=UPI0021576043|nr:EthD family reductase [Salipiger pentaromativorans]